MERGLSYSSSESKYGIRIPNYLQGERLRYEVAASSTELALRVAHLLYQELAKGGCFGFATGRTMEPIYAELVKLHRDSPLDGPSIHGFMVDEYLGLAADDPRSYVHYLRERVYLPLGIPANHMHVPLAQDPSAYLEEIRQLGGLKLQLLGIGTNGHIGFNEPGSSRSTHIRVVSIAESTRLANASLFASLSDVPKEAISLGVADIMRAEKVWLVANGLSKAEIVRRLNISGETSDLPASFLKSHPHFRVFLDTEAASLL